MANFLFLVILITVVIYASKASSKSVDTLEYFWQVTDIHYDANYSTKWSACHGATHGSFGDFSCDSPWRLVESAIEAMQKIKPDAQFILWTGDNVAHVPESTYNPKKLYSVIGNVTNLLRSKFPKTKIYPTIGNHDEWPANQVPVNQANATRYFNSLLSSTGWDSLLERESVDTFKKGGYYVEEFGPWKIFGLNTILWYSNNPLIKDASDPCGQNEWLDKELAMAKKQHKKVLLTGHVPPGYYPQYATSAYYLERFNEEFIAKLQDFNDTIEAGIFGHEHYDTFKLSSNSENPSTSIFLSPSVTPYTGKNPAIRLYSYNNKTGHIMDYTQYFLDLTKANLEEEVDWEVEYTLTEAYKLCDASAQSMLDLLMELKKPHSKMFDRYFNYFTVGHSSGKECNESCKISQVCSIEHLNTTEYLHCLNQSSEFSHHHHKIKPKPIHPVHAIPRYVYFIVGGLVSAAFIILIVIVVFCCHNKPMYGTRRHQRYTYVGINTNS